MSFLWTVLDLVSAGGNAFLSGDLGLDSVSPALSCLVYFPPRKERGLFPEQGLVVEPNLDFASTFANVTIPQTLAHCQSNS